MDNELDVRQQDFMLDLLPSFAEGFGVFTGVIAGVVVGTLITQLINYGVNKKIKEHAIKALKFELKYNINKVQEFLEELGRYKSAVLEGHVSMSRYFGYFRFSDIFSNTSTQLYQNGFLADTLSVEQVARLHDALVDLNGNGQSYMNDRIKNIRLDAQNHPDIWETNTKQRALDEIDFWKNKLDSHKAAFEDVKSSFVER